MLWIGYLLDGQEHCKTRFCSPKRYILYCPTGDLDFPVYVVALDLVDDHFDFVTGYPGTPDKEESLKFEGKIVRSSPYQSRK